MFYPVFIVTIMFMCYLKGCKRNICSTWKMLILDDCAPLGNPCVQDSGNCSSGSFRNATWKHVTDLGLGSWGTGKTVHGRTQGWVAGRVPLDGLPDPCPRGGQCAGRACRSHGLHGAWRGGRVHEGLLQLTSLSETRVHHAPCRGGTGQALCAHPCSNISNVADSAFHLSPLPSFCNFSSIFYIFIFFILSSLPFKIFPWLKINATHIFVIVWRALNTCIYQKGNRADVESTVSSFAWGTFFVNYFPILASYYAHHKTWLMV